jgi:hypothetical protein
MNTSTITAVRPVEMQSVKWPLERILFLMAGTVSLLGAALAAFVSPWFLLLSVAVGVNQLVYVAFRGCPASLVLSRFGVKAQCKW